MVYLLHTYIVAIVSDEYLYIYISVLFGLGARKCIFNDIFSWHVTSLAAAAAPHESFARTANFHFSFLFSFLFWLSSASFDFSAYFQLLFIQHKM